MIFLLVNMGIDPIYPISWEYLYIQNWAKEEKKDGDVNQKKGKVLPKVK